MNAAAVIVAHNHPSGDPDPSKDDWKLTKRLVKAGELLGVPVLDHLIVGRYGCESLQNAKPKKFTDGDWEDYE